MPIKPAKGVRIHRPVAVTTESPNISNDFDGGPEADPEAILGSDSTNPEDDLRNVVYSEDSGDVEDETLNDDEAPEETHDADSIEDEEGEDETADFEQDDGLVLEAGFGEETEEKLRSLILAFLDFNSEPTDEQFHALSAAVGIEHEDLEGIAYKLLGEITQETASLQANTDDPVLSPAVSEDDNNILVEDL